MPRIVSLIASATGAEVAHREAEMNRRNADLPALARVEETLWQPRSSSGLAE